MHTNLGDVIFYELLYLLCSNAVCGCLGNIVTHIAGELLWRDTSNNLMIICYFIATLIILYPSNLDCQTLGQQTESRQQ